MNLKSKADKYVKEQTAWLEKRGITVSVDPTTDTLYEDGLPVGGMFDAYKKSISVATGGKIAHWIPIFIHEVQHAKQFINQSPVWLDICNLYKGEDALGVIFNWLDGDEYPDSIVYKAIRLTQAVELDAEKKTVRELINTSLSDHINVLNYTKWANAYIYSYNIVYMYRQWPDDDPSKTSIITRSLPDHFNNDYTKLPMEFYRQALKYNFKNPKVPSLPCINT